MPEIPILTAKEIIQTLSKAGFRIIRSRGSHFRFEHFITKHKVTVSFHSGDVPRKTLKSILGQAGLTLEEFIRFLKK